MAGGQGLARDLPTGLDAAPFADVGLHEIQPLQRGAEIREGAQILAAGEWDGAFGLQRFPFRCRTVDQDRLLQPTEGELRQRIGGGDRFFQGPALVGIDEQPFARLHLLVEPCDVALVGVAGETDLELISPVTFRLAAGQVLQAIGRIEAAGVGRDRIHRVRVEKMA